MKPNISSYFLVAIIYVVGNVCNGETDYSTDPSSYYYDYEDNRSSLHDYEEEPQPSIQPNFVIEAQTFKVAKGRLIKLPCKVDSLGPTVISWKKVAPTTYIHFEILTAGNNVISKDSRISLADEDGHGSTLLIQLATEDDAGDYVCEVSSNPPVTLRHHVSLMSPPTVEILKPSKESSVYKVFSGDELALVCRGHGDPKPTLLWRRERKRMPDGRNQIEGSEIIFKNITRKHSGTYICEASNGSGLIVSDNITVEVQHAPEIVAEQEVIRQQDGIRLELICIVHAAPMPTVHWYRNGVRLTNGMDLINRVRIGHIGRKHILSISNFSEDRDEGIYTCHAENDMGEAKENLSVIPEGHEPTIRGQRNGKEERFTAEPRREVEMSDERTSTAIERSVTNSWSSSASAALKTTTAMAIVALNVLLTFL